MLGTTIAFETEFEVVCKCGMGLSVAFESPGLKKTANRHGEKLKAVVQPCKRCLTEQYEKGSDDRWKSMMDGY